MSVSRDLARSAPVGAAFEPVAADDDGFHARSGARMSIDIVAHFLQNSGGIRGNSRLQLQLVGLPLMMEAREIDGVLRVHSKSITFSTASVTPVMMCEPPGAPMTMNSLPSLSSIVGIMEERGRFMGWIALASPCTSPNIFGVPGLDAKSSISLFIKKPAPGMVTPQPKPPFNV